MVLSSVSVGTFADELIFEPEVSATTEAGEDEAYFGDDVVTGDEQNEEDSASDETFFADEVIEDDQVNDDVIAEDTADDQEAYAFEEDVDEPIVDNSDVYEAIAGEDASYEETVIVDATIPDVEKVYDGKPITVDTSKLTSLGDTILFYHSNASAPFAADALGAGVAWGTPTATTYSTGTWTTYGAWSKTALNIADVNQSTDKVSTDCGQSRIHWAVVLKDGKFVAAASFKVTIKPATITATLKDKKLTWGDDSTTTGYGLGLESTDFNITGMISGEDAPTLTIPAALTWGSLPTPDGKTIATSNAGTYVIADSAFADVVPATDDPNYKFEAKGGNVEVGKVNLTITWPTKTALLATGAEQDVFGNPPVAPTLSPATIGTGKVKILATYTGNKATDPGSYTAKIKTITLDGSSVDVSANFTVKNPTLDWSIGKTKARATIDASALAVYYGETTESVLKKLTLDNITFEIQNPTTGAWSGNPTADTTTVKATVTGTPTFRTDYDQYVSVTSTSHKTYTAWYVDGLTSTTYDIVTNNNPIDAGYKFSVLAAPVIVSANAVIVGIDAEPADLTDGYKLEDGKAAAKTIKGTADALARDIKDKRIKVTLTTTPDKPSAIGKYPINVKFENTSKDDLAVENFDWYRFVGGAQVATDVTTVAGTNGNEVTVKEADKYTVTWGDFKLTFDDYKGGYDGKEHGIVVEPAEVPASINIYYAKHDWTDAEVAAGAMLDANVPTSWAPKTRDATAFKNKAVSSTTMPTRKEVGKSTVYYYVESTD